MGEDLEWLLSSFGEEDLNINKYGESFKFPVDALIKSPRCIYDHDYTEIFKGSCKNYRLFWICCNISHII
ncbi:hypothetical protein Bca52824_011461 [Brassica carinata]|uniref:Uncharacterized protein n=1 Tax=Brassica carinata TaxID=52824 RepID=A0A8X8BBU7_BRACI|nr:hypothetical protein Bca52824_011461 [Brassica carinata]